MHAAKHLPSRVSTEAVMISISVYRSAMAAAATAPAPVFQVLITFRRSGSMDAQKMKLPTKLWKYMVRYVAVGPPICMQQVTSCIQSKVSVYRYIGEVSI